MPTVFLRDTIKKTPRKPQPFSERRIFTVSSPQILLSSIHREKIIKDIKEIVDAPSNIFTYLYEALICRFVEFVQILPTNNESRMGSIMDEGLLRGLFALQVLKKESQQEVEPLINYVMFSASLLFDIGFVTGNRLVNIVDKEGNFLGNWQPHLGPMQNEGHYKIRRGGGMPPWLSRRVAVLFARQVIPEVGFNWIASEAYALNAWIVLLNNEAEGTESLQLYIDRANEMLEEFKAANEFYALGEVEVTEADEVALGEEFLEWLENGLAEGKISVNQVDSNVHVVKEGLFIKVMETFDEFSKQNDKHPNAKVVLDQFKKMGFLSLVDGDVKTERYYFVPEKAFSHAFSSGAAQVTSKISLFRESLAKADINLSKGEIEALKGAPAISDVKERNIGNYGLQSGVIFDGQNASCLNGRINVNFNLPSNNMIRMEEPNVVPTEKASQQADNYPPEIAKLDGTEFKAPEFKSSIVYQPVYEPSKK